MARLRTVGRVVFLTLFGLVAVAFGATWVLTRTGLGQDLVLRQVVERVGGLVNGELSVGLVRSRQILLGGTFVDLAITDADGRPFLVADSVELRYSVPRLLAGQVRFTRLILHQPRITLERLPGQERLNVMRIFAGGDRPAQDEPALPDSATAGVEQEVFEAEGGGTMVAFRGVEIHNGAVDVILPLGSGPPPARGLVETLPGVEGRVRRFAFRDVNGVLDEMSLVDPALHGPRFVVDSLSATATILDDPLHLDRFTGVVAWGEEGVEVQGDPVYLPGTEASLTALVELGEGGPRVQADIDAWILSLADLRWAVPALPADGRGSARLQLGMRPGVIDLAFSDAGVDMGQSRVTGAGRVVAGRTVSLDGVDLQLEPLAFSRFEEYLPRPLGIEGWVRGRVRLAGPMTNPWMSAQVTLDQSEQGRGPTVVDATGIVHLDGSPGVTDFTAALEPAQFDLFTDVVPRLGIRGPGDVRFDASGRLADGMRFTAELEHRPVDLPASNVVAEGTLTRDAEGATALDLSGRMEPLSFTAWRAYSPDLPLSGEVRGTATAAGPLEDLRVTGDLETVAGSMNLDARFDARDPLARYRLEGQLVDFRLSELLPRLPRPSTVTASFQADGSGGALAVARGTVQVGMSPSRLGYLEVDTAQAMLRIADGFVHFDTLTARTSVMALQGGGALALADSLGSGRLAATFSTASLAGIRPYLMGDSLMARDTLSALEVDNLRLQGVEPDTLPLLADITVAGTATGDFALTGSIQSLDLSGAADLERVLYGPHRLARGHLSFGGEAVNTPDRALSATLEGDDLDIQGRRFASGRAEGEIRPGGGRLTASLRRGASEEYGGRATFTSDSTATVVNLDALTLRLDDRHWNLGGPARIAWGAELLEVDRLSIRRSDGQGLDLTLDGRMAAGETSDLSLNVRRLPVNRVAHVLQMDRDADYTGLLDLTVAVGGTLSEPTVRASVSGSSVGYESILLDRLEGELDYRDQRARTRLGATRGGITVLEADGTVPVDLSWRAEDRIPDAPIDLDIRVDAFPAALALGLLEAMDEVEGSLTGDFRVEGTLDAPAPSGSLRLSGGSALIPDLGVRHRNVEADLRLSPDGTVEVDGRLSSAGVMTVQGTVLLDTLSNPELDLTLQGAGFLAADRADVLATIGGSVTVEGRYQRPLVRGDVQVEEGALFLDEIVRTSTVVDLNDPLFLDVVDTTLIASQPLLAVGQNPFLQHLRLSVEMSLDRNFWLRSREMNVEIDGDLQVVWDRTRRDLAMLGELQAVRGTYSRFGRQFQVQQGTVRFIGTPGLDPDLNILAVNRLRVRDGEPLNIFALLQGTLLSPRVTLSSDAQPPIASSELVSYLIFGRPTYELASAEFSLVQGEFGGLFGSAAGAGASLAFGALGTQLGSAVAQEIGLDYFAISQAQGSAAFGTGFESALRATQVEVGWYVAQDLFLALLLRPLLGINSAGISGARLEWRATDLWTVEGFLEDRFARELNSGFSINEAFQVPKVWGLFLAREWGY